MATTSYADFLKTVNPNMLDNGVFRGPGSGVNFRAEGMSPEQYFAHQSAIQSQYNASNGGKDEWGAVGMDDPLAGGPISAAWTPGSVGHQGIQAGGLWAISSLTAGFGAAYGGAGMAGEAGVGAGAGVGEVGAGLGGEGFIGSGAADAGFSAAADTGLVAPSASSGFTGSMAMPELAGSMPAGVTEFSSAIPAAGAPVGSGLVPESATGLGGATAASGAPIGSGTAVEGGAAMTAAGTPATSPLAGAAGSSLPSGWGSLASSALKGIVGGAVNQALSPPTSGPNSAINAADPFHDQRPQYQSQLQAMMQGQFTPTDPSYQWRMDQGLKAVNRGAGASGMLHSGNRLQALEQYGQGLASTEYQNQYARLAQLSGANAGTGSAGTIAQGNAAAQQSNAAAVTNGIMNWGSQLYDQWARSTTPTEIASPGSSGWGMDLGFDN